MKTGTFREKIWVVALLAAVFVVVLIGAGCFGGGDEGTNDNGGTVPGGQGTSVSKIDDATTTLVAVIDPLSSFKSKDPFIPQARVTTTTAPPTTLPPTTAAPTTAPPTTAPPTTAPPTTAGPTTTAPHQLKIVSFEANGLTFTVDGIRVVYVEGVDLNNVYVGTWGTLKVTEINLSTRPYWASFLRDGKYSYERLELGETRTW